MDVPYGTFVLGQKQGTKEHGLYQYRYGLTQASFPQASTAHFTYLMHLPMDQLQPQWRDDLEGILGRCRKKWKACRLSTIQPFNGLDTINNAEQQRFLATLHQMTERSNWRDACQ